MPDHVHGLVEIMPVPVGGTVSTPCSLGNVIGAFKSLSARSANQVLGRRNVSFWQRGYYDRVVRSDDELERLRWYIDENPSRWAAARLLDDA
jgi:putative transposase